MSHALFGVKTLTGTLLGPAFHENGLRKKRKTDCGARYWRIPKFNTDRDNYMDLTNIERDQSARAGLRKVALWA